MQFKFQLNFTMQIKFHKNLRFDPRTTTTESLIWTVLTRGQQKNTTKKHSYGSNAFFWLLVWFHDLMWKDEGIIPIYTWDQNIWHGWPVYEVKCLPMFQRTWLGEYLILVVWRACDLHLVIISSLASKLQVLKVGMPFFQALYEVKLKASKSWPFKASEDIITKFKSQAFIP